MKKTTKRIVIGVAAFVAVICGLSSLVVTKENEYTLIMRFGKINSIKTEAGLSFKVPFLDSEQTLPKEILLYDMAASDVITKDKKTMIIYGAGDYAEDILNIFLCILIFLFVFLLIFLL